MAQRFEFKNFVASCADATDVTCIWKASLKFYYSYGIVMASYHLSEADNPFSNGQKFLQEGFPREWTCEYIERNLHVVDPMPELAEKLSRPFLWSEIGKLTELSEAQADFMDRRRAAELGDGLALHVFGPQRRNAYVGLGFGTETPQLSARETFELQCAAQMAHLRYCEMTQPLSRPLELSPRELEVLRWMARGKSNGVIADILGISHHTVDTIGRRLFEKLDVNDRTTAAIRGLGAGLLHFGQRDVV